MSDRSTVASAAVALANATQLDSDLCAPFVVALGVSGAVVTTLGGPLGSQTLCATDRDMALLDEIQLDLGEGPGWEAALTGRPVLEPDVQGSVNTTWPLARQALRETGIGAIFAFPLVVADLSLGAVDLYCRTPSILTAQQVADTSFLSGILARQVVRRALLVSEASADAVWGMSGDFSRREVHQATGMIVAQMAINPSDALLVLRGHAFASGRTVRDVALDVIARSLDFTPDTLEERF